VLLPHSGESDPWASSSALSERLLLHDPSLLVTVVREGRLELPRPLGHRILRLLALRTESRPACRLVSTGVVLYPGVSSRREQDVSKRSSAYECCNSLSRQSAARSTPVPNG
jgi:hypothetical protein